MLDGFSIKRDLSGEPCTLLHCVQGLENCPALSFTGRTTTERKKFLASVRVMFTDGPGFMHVDTDGILHVSLKYWKAGELVTIYLDLVHELVHVVQLRDGADLYDETYDYVDRPTEIEAYKTAVAEAKRLKLPKRVILDHMDVPWLDEEEKRRIEKNAGL